MRAIWNIGLATRGNDPKWSRHSVTWWTHPTTATLLWKYTISQRCTMISSPASSREIHSLRQHIKMYEETTGKETVDWKAYGILQYGVKWGFEEYFPNLLIILRTFLTMCVSIAACERSFSKLKLIKTTLRSTMSHSQHWQMHKTLILIGIDY